MLHTLNDGSVLKLISAKELVAIPIWNGNRIIDKAHVDTIKASVKDNIKALDFGFRIVTYVVTDPNGLLVKESKIIDGQHRHRVLRDYFLENYFQEDFQIVVLDKEVTSESEKITYFKQLNTQLPIAWKSDPAMVTNEYIKALEAKFNTKKESMIRDKSTKRPYLSVEKVREEFQKIFKVKGVASESPEDINAFVERVVALNERLIQGADMAILQSGKKETMDIIQKAAAKKFMLAVDPKLKWISLCLPLP
jgi:hypothetical protein